MANEFVVRNGIVALGTSSFSTDVKVSGSIIAPFVVHPLTASWAINTLTASFVATASWSINAQTASYISQTNVAQAGYVMSIHTASSYINTTNVWEKVPFSTNLISPNGFTHASALSGFTSSVAGIYRVRFDGTFYKVVGGANNFGLHITHNEQEVTGSYTYVSMPFSNTYVPVNSEVFINLSNGSRLSVEIVGDTNQGGLSTQNTIGATGPFVFSSKLQINRI